MGQPLQEALLVATWHLGSSRDYTGLMVGLEPGLPSQPTVGEEEWK